MTDAILEMRGISKAFHGVKALSDVNLTVRAGEIHAIVGENGAGKPTLMKVLSGVNPYGAYEGEIRFQGKECRFKGIADSEKLGIIIIHQELALVPLLSIAENIFLGNEQARFGVIDWSASFSKPQALLKKVGLNESPTTLITNLGVGKQQLVEIAKALSKEVQLLILDEPTASLNETDSDGLLKLLLELQRHGIACILISHKLNEISKVADSITILRDGAMVETLDCHANPSSEDRVIKSMVGREMADRYPKRTPNIGDVVFSVKDWRVHHAIHADRQVIKGVDLHVKRGESLGIAGLMGAGRTELAMSIFGRSYGQGISGKVFLHGKEIDVSSIQKAINHGIAYVTEDRKGYGLVLMLAYDFVTTRTTIGRRVYARGSNVKAAKLSGIKTERLTFYTFMNMGVLAALAGLVFAARLNTATPKAGLGFELDVIAACFIGGASASGGVGRVLGAVIGAFIMGVMNNGMSIMGIGIDYQQVIKGLVLLAAVCVDVHNKNK